MIVSVAEWTQQWERCDNLQFSLFCLYFCAPLQGRPPSKKAAVIRKAPPTPTRLNSNWTHTHTHRLKSGYWHEHLKCSLYHCHLLKNHCPCRIDIQLVSNVLNSVNSDWWYLSGKVDLYWYLVLIWKYYSNQACCSACMIPLFPHRNTRFRLGLLLGEGNIPGCVCLLLQTRESCAETIYSTRRW